MNKSDPNYYKENVKTYKKNLFIDTAMDAEDYI